MTDPRPASLGAEAYPEIADSRRQEAESLLLRTLELLHAGPLTAEQRQEMAQVLTAQMEATARLRRFALGNDDAPYFVTIPARGSRDV